MKLAAALVLVAVIAPVASAQLFGPLPYLQKPDSPWDLTDSDMVFEDFEDGSKDTPLTTFTPVGQLINPSGATDSVDADDGAIDGSGTGGHSFFTQNGAVGFTITFQPDDEGRYPTHAGLAWTDGEGSVSFQAFTPGGAAIGCLRGTHADGSVFGTTAEDRFYGIAANVGIGSIKITNVGGGLEIDHIQYGDYDGSQPSGCPADIDGNGVLNIFDFLGFQGAFGAELPSADFAAPCGTWDIFDFLAFQTAFGNGC